MMRRPSAGCGSSRAVCVAADAGAEAISAAVVDAVAAWPMGRRNTDANVRQAALEDRPVDSGLESCRR